MTRFQLARCRFVICLFLTALAVPIVCSGADRPNLIVVFIDDMGWRDFSCFGNRAVATENIDRLAAEGVRFRQFYVNSPICSPSRTAISTGQYPQRWRITSYLANRRANKERGVAQWLDPSAPMLARLLKQAGYATGHFGKWHMGGQRDVGEAPLITEYGFDKSLTNFEGLGPRVLPLCDAHDGKPPRKHALGSDKLGRGPIVWEDRSLVTKAFTAAALDFIKTAESKDRPFYVNVWPDDVHSPFFPPEARRGDQAKATLYHGVLDTMDEQLGELFDYVRNSSKLKDNTLILVCSDNGPELGAGSAGPFRGYKTMLFEGGVRSPLIAWGPGLVDARVAGTMNSKSVFSAIDLAPSLLALAGVESTAKFDGESLPDVLTGRSQASRRRPLFFRRPPDRDRFYGVDDLPDLAMRAGKWKLLCEYDGGDPLLFDLSIDESEKTNLAAEHEEIVKRMTAELVAWHASMPADKGNSTCRRGQLEFKHLALRFCIPYDHVGLVRCNNQLAVRRNTYHRKGDSRFELVGSFCEKVIDVQTFHACHRQEPIRPGDHRGCLLKLHHLRTP
ncbi:MAG: sulfatase-like hydrolase/transferase [Pirellulaceae bacterium]|nr:sulfatase-like hydrolase/transferase [Pirellulaceae bacterium]MDP7019292.1 sulfatase-like hydrolase/transferase [Pirellulaceae bacterium]